MLKQAAGTHEGMERTRMGEWECARVVASLTYMSMVHAGWL